MANCYLSQIVRPAIRSMAGFSSIQSDYYLRRDIVVPPDSLSLRIFPQVEEIELALREERSQPTIALQSFIDVLKFFRRVILQDSAVLLNTPGFENLNLFIFRHEIFQSPDFNAFKEYVSFSVKSKILRLTQGIAIGDGK
jgi:hypothetical protein